MDGWTGYGASGDGSTGYFASVNSTGFPTGSNPREIRIMFKLNKDPAIRQVFAWYGSPSAANMFGLQITNGNFNLYDYNGDLDVAYKADINNIYFAVFQYDGASVILYINGVMVFKTAKALNTTASVMTLMQAFGALFSDIDLYFVELKKILSTSSQIASLANKLCLPCSYTDSGIKKDIREILPVNSINRGYVRTDSSKVIESDQESYKYGTRYADERNKREFLGSKFYNGLTTLTWNNPFGTRKIKTYFTWSQDANGMTECDVPSVYVESSTYRSIAPQQTSSQRIQRPSW